MGLGSEREREREVVLRIKQRKKKEEKKEKKEERKRKKKRVKRLVMPGRAVGGTRLDVGGQRPGPKEGGGLSPKDGG